LGYIAQLRKLIGTRPIFLVGSCVLVFDDEGRLLLQKRSDSLDWGTIGGSLELGETFEQAAARELYEEAGLTAGSFRFVALLAGEDLYYRYPHGDEVYNVVGVFEAVDVRGVPTIRDEEGLDLRYFPLNQPIPNLNRVSRVILQKTGFLHGSLNERNSE
jgi:8-oxo-dGTP pyrophosphatase MutT (NUDIX family)